MINRSSFNIPTLHCDKAVSVLGATGLYVTCANLTPDEELNILIY